MPVVEKIDIIVLAGGKEVGVMPRCRENIFIHIGRVLADCTEKRRICHV